MSFLEGTFLGCRLVLLVVFAYLLVGCLFYRLVETKGCESDERLYAEDYDENSCQEAWTMVDALYFLVVTMSTVGYGDFGPSTAGSKAFTCIYIVLGVAFVFLELSTALGKLMMRMEQGLLQFLDRFDKTGIGGIAIGAAALRGACGDGISGSGVDISGNGEVDFMRPPRAHVFWAQNLAPWLVSQIALQFLAAGVFTATEPGLSFGDAFYHCVVTITTVGYGDVSLSTQASRLWAFCHIMLGVSWFAGLVARVQRLYGRRKASLQRAEFLGKQLDEDLVMSLDQDENGVDKLEFVIGMMVKLGAELCGKPLSWDDVQPFLTQFDAAPKSGMDGRMTRLDLASLVHSKKELLRKSQQGDSPKPKKCWSELPEMSQLPPSECKAATRAKSPISDIS